MNNKYLLILFVLLVQFSCKENETLTSFTENNKKIEDSNENYNIKNESFLEAIYIQAEKDDSMLETKERAKKVHAIGVDFYKYIDDLKHTIKEKNSMEFVNELFFNNNEITAEGEEFMMYVKNYRQSMNATIGKSNPRIVGMVNNNFDTSDIENRRGQKTNWLNLNFRDLFPIVSITKLSTMQSDIRRIETQYLAELLGVKLHTRTKTVNKIKSETQKELGENIKPETDFSDNNDPKEDVAVENVDSPKKETPVKEAEDIVKKEIVKTPEVKKDVSKKVSTQKYYTVKKGENLYRIALKNKLSVADLKKLNHMSSNSISVGQKLKVN